MRVDTKPVMTQKFTEILEENGEITQIIIQNIWIKRRKRFKDKTKTPTPNPQLVRLFWFHEVSNTILYLKSRFIKIKTKFKVYSNKEKHEDLLPREMKYC